jgi:hypothetical protein
MVVGKGMVVGVGTPSLKILCVAALAALSILSGPASAQENEEENAKEKSGQNVGYEFGVHVGNLLPNQISGVREITGLGGARFGYNVGDLTFVEGGFMTGNGDGVEWKNVEVSIRMDIPVEHLIGMAYIGPDLNYYKPNNSDSNKLIFGAHAGGGMQTKLGRFTWFRADMKFAVSPGTSLYIGFGFVFRMPGGNQGPSNN